MIVDGSWLHRREYSVTVSIPEEGLRLVDDIEYISHETRNIMHCVLAPMQVLMKPGYPGLIFRHSRITTRIYTDDGMY